MNKTKNKFLRYFNRIEAKQDLYAKYITFNLGRYKFELEDNDWEEPCFNVCIYETYVTYADSVKRLNKILKLL